MNVKHETRSQIKQATKISWHILIALALFASVSVFVLGKLTHKPIQIVKNTASGMSTISYQEVPSGRDDVRRFRAKSSSNEPISIKSWMTQVSSKSTQGTKAAMDLSQIISSSDYESIFFETMGTSWSDCDTTRFEFAMVHRPSLKKFAEGSPDRYAFEEHFSQCMDGKGDDSNKPTVCSFGNLGGDARLVSPLPQGGVRDIGYSHLAAFVRNAPRGQIAEFWALGAEQYLNELKNGSGEKRWFSTNGMGVAWLHLRLDTKPKYYSYAPFK